MRRCISTTRPSAPVELTRKYENEDVVSFVNGILGGFAREVQQSC